MGKGNVMTNLLLRLFVRDHQDPKQPRVRSKVGKLSGIVGILCNIVLFALKLVVGTISGSVAITADAFNNLSDAASSVGVNIFKSKLLCFVIAGFFTALAGGWYFLNNVSIYPASGYGNSWTVAVVFIVIIGGIGTMAGPIVGSVIYIALAEILADYPGWSNIILGLIAILVILFLPDGIMGTLQKKFNFEILSQKRLSKE